MYFAFFTYKFLIELQYNITDHYLWLKRSLTGFFLHKSNKMNHQRSFFFFNPYANSFGDVSNCGRGSSCDSNVNICCGVIVFHLNILLMTNHERCEILSPFECKVLYQSLFYCHICGQHCSKVSSLFQMTKMQSVLHQ